MKTLTIRKGLSHLEQMFADNDEVLAVCRGEPEGRILPAKPKMQVRSLAIFRVHQPVQTAPSEEIVSEDSFKRC